MRIIKKYNQNILVSKTKHQICFDSSNFFEIFMIKKVLKMQNFSCLSPDFNLYQGDESDTIEEKYLC